jgi:ABC-type nitrate/sulfonate/bicarbonate transport system permease component
MILAVFPILINTLAAMRNVSTNLIDVGTAFASRECEILTKIILPSALPDMMTGLRLGIGRAIIGLVVAKFFHSDNGPWSSDRQIRPSVRYGLHVRPDTGA